jgi:hypothetical protein
MLGGKSLLTIPNMEAEKVICNYLAGLINKHETVLQVQLVVWPQYYMIYL